MYRVFCIHHTDERARKRRLAKRLRHLGIEVEWIESYHPREMKAWDHEGLSANSGGQGANAWDLVNPEDIESIEVIKGPAAATLYGADAAGGVIQIITKKGARGQQRAQWGAKIEMGRNDLGAVDLPTNYTLCTQARIAATSTINGQTVPTYPGCQGKPVNTLLTESPLRDFPGALRDGAVRNYSLNVRGGGDRFSYYVGGDHDEEEGVLYNSRDRRQSLRSNFTFAP